MRNIIIGSAILVVLGLALVLVWRSRPEHYGGEFKGLSPASIQALVEKPADFLKKEFKIEGKVMRQCPSSGCWFYLADSSSKEIKVEMSDAVAKLPTRVGKMATVEGQLIKFGDEYEFIGSGVEFH